MLAEHQVPLIEDDVYGELYFGNTRPTLAKAFDSEGLVMHCSSFSKCLAPGYRVGWVAPGRFMREVARQKLTLSLTTSAPAQITLAAYLERGGYDRHLRQLRDTLATQRDAYIQAIVEHFPAGTRATRPAGGYFLWIELPGQVDTLVLHRDALAAGVSIAPGPIFSASRGHRHCLRFNYGHPLDDRARGGLATLGTLIAAQIRTDAG
jgi:DNA-binding transcriptional MocR family regulator